MKKIFTITLTLITFISFSQSNDSDYLVTVDNDTIHCKIIELKNKKISYIINGEKRKKKKIYSNLQMYILQIHQ